MEAAEIEPTWENLSALCMLAGYRRDAAADTASGEYNPVNSGAWDADRIEVALRSDLNPSGTEALDSILTADEAVQIFWEP